MWLNKSIDILIKKHTIVSGSVGYLPRKTLYLLLAKLKPSPPLFQDDSMTTNTEKIFYYTPLSKVTGIILGGCKGGRCVGLTNLPPSCAICFEIGEPQPPGTI
jgi:hypothetical protein